MASSAASESILFIAAIVVTTAFVGVMAGVVNNLSDDVRERGTVMSDGLRADITIINDAENVANNPVVFYIKNTGKINLFSQETEVLIDGVIYTDTDLTFDVLDSSEDDAWLIGQVLQITVDVNLSGGDHKARIVSQTGVYDELLFNL